MKKLLLASAALAALSTSALAADVPVRAAAPTPVFVAQSSWTGFYAGAVASYTQNNKGARETDYGVFGDCDSCNNLWRFVDITATDQKYKSKGIGAGATLGYNVQAGSFVLGVEADLQGLKVNGSNSYQTTDGTDRYYTRARTDSATKLDWMGTLRARAGVLVMPSTLVYATGGLAYGQAKATLNINGAVMLDGYPNVVGNNVTDTKTKTGWVLGGGIEQKLSSRWTLKAEYLHYDLGKMTVTNTVDGLNSWACCSGNWGSVYKTNQYKLGGETVRVGLNYRFGEDAAAVVAKY